MGFSELVGSLILIMAILNLYRKFYFKDTLDAKKTKILVEFSFSPGASQERNGEWIVVLVLSIQQIAAPGKKRRPQMNILVARREKMDTQEARYPEPRTNER